MFVRFLPMIGAGIVFILAALRFRAIYPKNAGKEGFGPYQIVGAVVGFVLGVGLLVWSFLAIVGIAPTQ